MLQGQIVEALGTMSGTSLDGVDAATIRTDGQRIHGFGPSRYQPYSTAVRDILRVHLGRWQDDDVATAAALIEAAHFDIMQHFGRVDLAGFHGQTLAHDPGGKGTHQCGNGQNLADALGYPVAWDFRTADVAAGGQGAPLAPFYHFALAKWLDADAPLAFLNLGGVGNITWVNPAFDDPADPGALLAFDTGPANAPMNDLMQTRRGIAYDKGGAVAGAGTADKAIVAQFMTRPYFARAVPKSLDRDSFRALQGDVAALADEDAMATLAQAVASSVAQGLTHCPQPPAQVLVTGGGRHNKTLMGMLAAALPCDVKPVEDFGLDGDMIEAQAFAYLAVRAARGLPLSCPQTTGVPSPLTGARIAIPA